MARITISLPEELKAELLLYAETQGTTVSEAAQNALQNFLSSPPTAPAHPPLLEQEIRLRLAQLESYAAVLIPEQNHRINDLESHVAMLTYQTEHLRQGLAQVAGYFKSTLGRQLPCPRAATAPPWDHSPPPGWGDKYPNKYLP
jgi:uncharacterized coiled-coil protein SlyX